MCFVGRKWPIFRHVSVSVVFADAGGDGRGAVFTHDKSVNMLTSRLSLLSTNPAPEKETACVEDMMMVYA